MVRLAPFIETGFAAILNNADDDASDQRDDDGGGAMTGSNSNPSAVTSSSSTSFSSSPTPSTTASSAHAMPYGNNNNNNNNNNILSTGNPADAMPFASPVKTTRVDGIGIWRSWKRNFSTPLLALLDLIDNSLDAAIASQLELLLHAETAATASRGGGPPSFVGRVHIHPDTYDTPHPHHLRQHPHHGSGNFNSATSTTTGVCIVNNSHKKIRPLAKVLEVYNSSKIHSGAGDIGENGVGLKQGCATLSQLSFVLVKNGGNDKVELGIVAESLQRLEGCYLPAFQFDNSHGPNNPSLHRQMQALFSQPQHQDIAACIAKYGAPKASSPPNLSIGIDRLCRKFDDICYRFHDCDHVFALVLDKVVHGMNNEKTGAAPANEHEHRVRVQEYMRALQEELPKTYLHIPDDFEFLIDGKKLAFKHWPSRLVELAVFPLTVSKTQPLLKMRGNFHDLEEGNVENSYRLRVFLGFDKERVVIKDAKKEASLYVYSRQSGRLIKVVADSRTDLSLSAGGTMFCQGLTIIIDDIGGHLPLNPTKQDVAFGEENCGGIHKENLYQSVGAVTNFYYNYHLEKYGGRKQVLTRKIADLADARVNRPFKSIDSSNVTTFDNVKFKKAHRNIRIVTKPMPEEVIGDDTVYRLERPMAQTSTSGRKRPIEAVSSSSVPMQQQPLLPAPVTSSQIETQSIPRRSFTAPGPPREPTPTPISHASTTITTATSRSSQNQSQPHSARKPTGILRNRGSPAKAQNGYGQNPNQSPIHDNASRQNSKYFTQQRGRMQQPVTQEDEEEEGEVVTIDRSGESEDLEMDDSVPSPIVSGTPASPSSRNGDDVEVLDSEDDNGDTTDEYGEGQLVINERTPPKIILTEMQKYQGLCEQLTLKVESEKEARKREKKDLKKEKRENAELKLENERLMAKVAELERMVAMSGGQG